MIKTLIYQIREKPDMYQYLKYNSYLYKNIIRGNITYKDIERKMKIDLNKTPIDKLKEINNKIEFINTFFNIIN